MFRRSFHLFALLFLTFVTPVSYGAFDHQHRLLDNLLEQVVVVNGQQSRVDYPKVIQHRDHLDQYLSNLSGVTRRQFQQFSSDEQLAFLINTYNAYQLKQVIDHYPISSIKDVGSFFSSPWSKEFFTLFGEPASLDYVEHELIRQNYPEPRIHFAVNCASISCPPLMPQAYQGAILDQQLDVATANFLADREANRVEGDTLVLSKIFDWYETDFEPNVVDFVRPYMNLGDKEYDLRYSRYDWGLNQLN